MRRLLAILFALALVPLTPIPPTASAQPWSGPASTIANHNGRKVIQLCDQGGPCRTTTPFFMALNSQSVPVGNGDWSYFDYQARLAAANTAASDMNVAPMLQVHLMSTSDAFIDQLAGKLNALNPRPYLMVRMYLQDAPAFGREAVKMKDLQGNVRDDTNGAGHPWSLNEAWLAYQEEQISRVLTRMDTRYPGRVMGVLIAYANGGEWFYRPYGYDDSAGKMLDWGDPRLCGPVPGAAPRCGMFPWTNDSGSQPGAIGRHHFYLGDYSAGAEAGFCTWPGLPASLVPQCRSATPTERNNAVPGQVPPVSGAARGTILDPADPNSLRAAKDNQYHSSRTVSAITRLLAKAEQVTGNRVLTAAFYGYQYGLGTELPVSGHNDLATLVNSPSVDIISGPYSYRESRLLGHGFVQQGITDTMRLSDKLWMDEDDTRTFLACEVSCQPVPFQTVTNLWDSIRVLRRNLIAAGIGGRAVHLLDLQGVGWFGRPDRPGDSEALWANLQSVFRAVDKIRHGGANAYRPQVAVFVDDVSPNYQAALTPAGENSYGFASDQLPNLVEDLTRLGTPVRHYLLSDLAKGNLDLSAIKLAVLPNAYVVSSAVRSAINTKLKTPGRTVLTFYAGGYVQDDQAASIASMTALTGITVAKGSGTPALTQDYSFVGQTGGPGYPLTPWFTVTDPAATTLATYQAGGVSLARKTIPVSGGSYTSVYAAAPKLPLAALRRISEDAGVHHFAPVGDSVEAEGNMVAVHAGTTGSKSVRLPASMPRVYETALYPNDVEMCRNCTQLANQAFNEGDTRVFRWTSPPRGNFELLTGTAVEGWAADVDLPATSSAVAVYRGGPAGVGTYLGEFPTSTDRPDVNAYFGITGVHGFRFTVPNCAPGTPVHLYAVDPEGAAGDGNTYLGGRLCT
ncbi:MULTISPECIES: hypothetical protein [Saccharothrix]|uniref:hypothetical protein n=1 Tax=Saccharothrix TaxID=2071 RepID=UPI00093F61D5|nr:hypothetical protein [Saccharothrix sp. CB00851]OKI31992.1 hypothetical protein A6A25_26475 [Saccharothrix sp. CB00851]